MVQKEQLSIQRTLVVVNGKSGEGVAAHLTEMLAVWRNPPVVAVRQVDDVPEAGVVIDAALMEISRLSHRNALQRLGFRLERLGELVIWIVGDSDDVLYELARLAVNRSECVLSTEPDLMGIVIRSADDGGETGGGKDIAVAARPPTAKTVTAFNGPCYVATLLNESGLSLDNPDALHERIARFIALHTCTALRDSPTWLMPVGVLAGPPVCSSFGLVWVQWPGAVARSHAVEELKKALVDCLIGTERSSARSPLDDVVPAPGLLAGPITPEGLADRTYDTAHRGGVPDLWEVFGSADRTGHPLLARWKEIEQGCEEVLAKSETAWEDLTRAVVIRRAVQLKMAARQVLDMYGVRAVQIAVAAVRDTIEGWSVAVAQREAEAAGDLGALQERTDTLWAELTLRLERMPRRRVRDLLRLALHPVDVALLWRAWRQLRERYQQYTLLQAAMLGIRITRRQMQQVAAIYQGIDRSLVELQTSLYGLADTLQSLLAPADSVPAWPVDMLMPAEPGGLLELLMEKYVPSAPAVAAQLATAFGAPSAWLDTQAPSKEAVAELLARLVEPVGRVSLSDVIAFRFDGVTEVGEWLRELKVQAQPFWRWDPTVLSDGERLSLHLLTLCLAAPEVAAEAVADDDMRMLPLEQVDRLAVVTIRGGMPVRDV